MPRKKTAPQRETDGVTEISSFQPSASQGSGGQMSQRRSGVLPTSVSRRGDTARHAAQERKRRKAERARRAETAAIKAAEEAEIFREALRQREEARLGRHQRDIDRFGKSSSPASRRASGNHTFNGFSGGAGDDEASFIPSPSSFWQTLTLPTKTFIIVSGFLWMYYELFAKSRLEASDDEDDGRDGDADSSDLLSTPDVSKNAKSPKRLPPIWHNEVLKTLESKSRPDVIDTMPRNYALESAEKAAKEAGVAPPGETSPVKAKTEPLKATPSTISAAPEAPQKPGLPDTPDTPESPAKSEDASIVSPVSTKKGKNKKTKKGRKSKGTKTKYVGENGPVGSNKDAEAVTMGSTKHEGDKSTAESPPDNATEADVESPVSSAGSSNSTVPAAGLLSNTTALAAENTTETAFPSNETAAANATKFSYAEISPSSAAAEGAIATVPGAANAIGFDGAQSAGGQTISKDQTATDSTGHALFKNLNTTVPEGEIPVIHWNYDKVLDPRTSRQYFVFKEHDHVGTFKPLCVNPVTQKIYTVPTPKICSGYNRTNGWMLQYCSSVEASYDKESNMVKEEEVGGAAWFAKQKETKNIEWIEGLTVLQLLSKDCGNIAHFAGRATMLQHVLDNISAYAAAPLDVENILIVPSFHIMKRFLYPHNYAFWHKTFLRSILAPAHYTIGTLGNFFYRMGKEPYNGTPRVQLLHNFSLSGSKVSETKVVCFRRAIVPGYFKDRYFPEDREYPSDKPSLQSKLPGTPPIPRDSLRMRERVSALLHNESTFKPMAKKMVYLDRGGERRSISQAGKADVFAALKIAAEKRSFKFEVINFDGKTFKEQVETMESVGIAIGVHGANLVNTMFMVREVLADQLLFGFLPGSCKIAIYHLVLNRS